MARVHVSDVRVRYRGTKQDALRGVTFEAGDGVIGLVGPNGAGKTTLLRVLLGALEPQAGGVRLDGELPSVHRRRHGIGFLPERPAFEPWLTVAEFLTGIADLRRARSPSSADLRFDGLDGLRGKRLDRLSLGEQRRVEIAAALAGSPALLLLDEPTNGLDPGGIAALREAIQAARRPGRTIVVSSHHLDELQRIADSLLFVRDGRITGRWTREEALERFGSFDALFREHVGMQPVEVA